MTPPLEHGGISRMRNFFIALFACAALALWPDAAVAQSFPCPNGPGPGEYQVGVMGGSHGVAAIPLCASNGGDGSGDDEEAPSAPRRPSKPGAMATAYHVDTSSMWSSVGHKNVAAAKKRALDGCNAATGGGCYLFGAFEGIGLMATAQDAMGQLWIKQAVGNEVLAPGEPSIEYCLANSFGCDYLGVHESGLIFLDEDPALDQSEDRFPKGKLNWNRWAMVARPTTPTTTAHSKSWLISGKENSAATRKEILDRCKAESGVPCEIAGYAVNGKKQTENGQVDANGVLVHFVDARGRNRWISAGLTKPPKKKKPKKLFRDQPDPVTYNDPVIVQERIDRLCPKSLPCKVIATYDAATPRMQVIEDVK